MKPTRKWSAGDIGDQTGRVAIVTGANRGIGLPTTEELSRRGARVVMACRSVESARAAAGRIGLANLSGSVEVMELDLANLASIREFAEEFRRRFERLDLLINNAGVMLPPLTRTADGFEVQIGTNHLGHFALTARLLKLLVETAGSRVVTVASTGHRFAAIDFDDLQWQARKYQPIRAYFESKLANLLFTYELQRRFDRAGVQALAVAAHPGWTGTDLLRFSRVLQWLSSFLAMSPLQGALPTLYAATAPDVQPGGYYGPDGFAQISGYPGQVRSSSASRDSSVAARLWTVSEELVSLQLAP
ncbi:MAG: oxidoreductase [Acidobacteria bacterium]|nr:oxidoreductase [Acidobacteriota bacterium]